MFCPFSVLDVNKKKNRDACWTYLRVTHRRWPYLDFFVRIYVCPRAPCIETPITVGGNPINPFTIVISETAMRSMIHPWGATQRAVNRSKERHVQDTTQACHPHCCFGAPPCTCTAGDSSSTGRACGTSFRLIAFNRPKPVSYTHLTLPTIYSV